jgi:hypothetical protein
MVARFAVAGLLVTAVALAASAPTRRDAESLSRKLEAITQHAQREPRPPRDTTITENEVNAYLQFAAADELPTGVVDPAITMIGEGRVAGRATVDLDRVRREKSSGGWFDPTSYLTGRLPISATGVLHAREGMVRFDLQSAEVSGIPVPKSVLQEIVSHYSRSPERPDGLSLDGTYRLPAKVREIQVDRGHAVVVQ